MLYYAYIYSKIQYGIEAYGAAPAKTLKKIQVKQNRSIKVLFIKDFYTPTKELHKELKLLTVQDIAKLSIIKFTHKQQNNDTPDIFNDVFTVNNTLHQHSTRQEYNLNIPLPKTENDKKKISYRGPTLWNSIPRKIRDLKTTKTFSKHVREHLISKY